jgi:hypothetical protein
MISQPKRIFKPRYFSTHSPPYFSLGLFFPSLSPLPPSLFTFLFLLAFLTMSDRRKYSPSSKSATYNNGSDDDYSPHASRDKFRRERSLDGSSYMDSYSPKTDEYGRYSRSKRYLRSPSPTPGKFVVTNLSHYYTHTLFLLIQTKDANTDVLLHTQTIIQAITAVATTVDKVVNMAKDETMTMLMITTFQTMSVMVTLLVPVMEEPLNQNNNNNNNNNTSSHH